MFTKPFIVHFFVLELSKLKEYGRYIFKILLSCRKGNVQIQYLNADSFLFSFTPKESSYQDKELFIKDLNLIEFSLLHELNSEENKG